MEDVWKKWGGGVGGNGGERGNKQKNHMMSRMAELPEGKCLQENVKCHAGLGWAGVGIGDRWSWSLFGHVGF